MKALHKVRDVVLLGLRSLLVHKVRSFLTALGILFAVWSVIAMLAISEGLGRQAQESLRELGSDNIIINAEKPPTSEKASDASGVAVYGLTHADARRLKENLPGVVRAVVARRTRRQAYAGDKKQAVSVIATESAYAQVAKMRLSEGRFLTAADELQSKAHCVITAQLARKLFAFDEPLNKIVRLDTEPFVVVGILERLPQALAEGTADPGNCLIIPLSTEKVRFGEYNVSFEQGSITLERVEVSQIVLQMSSERAVVEGGAIAGKLLKRFHETLDYNVKVPLELMEQRAKQSRIWNFMFLAIASVSLLVGGIGIMNIMLASVTERTREIGIRRALGAKRRDITVQFLVESVTLTTVGGAVGIAIGIMVPKLVGRFLSFQAQTTAAMLLLPLAMAVAVGMLSGLYPAHRAARLDPIIALRHE